MTINLTKTEIPETPEQSQIRRLRDSRDFWKRQNDYAEQRLKLYQKRLYDCASALQAAENGVSVVQYHRSRLQEELDTVKAELAALKARSSI